MYVGFYVRSCVEQRTAPWNESQMCLILNILDQIKSRFNFMERINGLPFWRFPVKHDDVLIVNENISYVVWF
jgi:hypothetical protein